MSDEIEALCQEAALLKVRWREAAAEVQRTEAHRVNAMHAWGSKVRQLCDAVLAAAPTCSVFMHGHAYGPRVQVVQLTRTQIRARDCDSGGTLVYNRSDGRARGDYTTYLPLGQLQADHPEIFASERWTLPGWVAYLKAMA